MNKSKLTAKQKELKALEISLKDENRLWKKFQLEWNFHSNHIEGNTLTYGDTELLFNYGTVTGTHSLRDIEEMKAHDVAVSQLRALAEDVFPITEGHVKSLNKTLLKEPFLSDAITSEGNPTKKYIVPGEYKTAPNSVTQKDGSKFEYCSPEQVASEMHELISWLRGELEKPTMHPIETATILHHRFVLIHPFDDGNGRTARLLMNYVLLKTGYPPVIVRTEKKAEYLAALQLADSGEFRRLTEFLAEELDWSLVVSIKAAKGESIVDEDDLDKEIAIFVKNQQVQQERRTERTKEVIQSLAKSSFFPLFDCINEKLEKFSPLFKTIHCGNEWERYDLKTDIKDDFLEKTSSGFIRSFQIIIYLTGHLSDSEKLIEERVEIYFEDHLYLISLATEILISQSYDTPLLSSEIKQISKKIQSNLFEKVKEF